MDYCFGMIFSRAKSGAIAVVVLATELGTVAILDRLGSVKRLAVRWDDLGGWLAETATEDVLVALVRLAALVLAWWLLASTALYLTASVLRLRGLVHGLRWATLPGVRRLVDGIVAGSIVASATLTTGGPAFAQVPPAPAHAYIPRPAGDAPAPWPIPAGDGAPATTAPVAPTTTLPTTTAVPVLPTTTTTTTPTEAQVPAPSDKGSAPEPAVRTYRVRPGDNLWTVAEGHLADRTGRADGEVGLDEVRAYWLRLVEANRPRLASGDPDLIYPGEILVLPDVADW